MHWQAIALSVCAYTHIRPIYITVILIIFPTARKDALIASGCVEALQRVVASPQHALWPNPRERTALEDAVAASLPVAWAWRGRIEAREILATAFPFWDGGGAEEGEEKWFKSLAQTASERLSLETKLQYSE